MPSIQGDTFKKWLTFGEVHKLVWKTDFADIGITEAEGTAYSVLVANTKTKLDAMLVKKEEAKAATLAYHTAAQDMHDEAAALISKIRGYAATQANPNAVYEAALLPAPAAPTPAGPPVDCTNLTASLTNSGNVELAWEGSLAHSQFFSVYRKMAGASTWTLLGSVRSKSFMDTTLPEGATGGQYQVKALRGNQESQGCEPVGVIFGTVPMAA